MGVGYDELTQNDDMKSARPQATLTWRPTDKLTLTVSRGVERRKVLGDNSNYISNPIYSSSLAYRPGQTTTFSVSASRNVSASYFDNQLTRSIQWGASIQQRFLQRYYFTVSTSHGNTTYISTATGLAGGRDDSYVSYSAKVETTVFQRGTLGLSYDTSQNASSLLGFTYKSYQIGANFGYRF